MCFAGQTLLNCKGHELTAAMTDIQPEPKGDWPQQPAGVVQDRVLAPPSVLLLLKGLWEKTKPDHSSLEQR